MGYMHMARKLVKQGGLQENMKIA
ncbi:uncharacterized protein G2W53_015551 [Senna tora]|uniref:Uncharacterized protein n=1 Tax=Senna tora TaxID=362788 RepID=A0A834WWH1_9FABA|nr:uncharacterized protein G2W53_015551 [Senna tora]